MKMPLILGTERARQLRSRFVSQTTNAYNSLGTRAYTNRPASSSVYTYDAVARLSQLGQHFASSASNLEQGFGYNNASQITTATRDNDAFVFDGLVAVNRNYTVNGLNQYTAVGALPAFQYDDNGNLTYDGSNNYAYDAENRLVGVTGARTANLVYDPLGRLLQVDEGTSGTTSLFLYDGDNLAAEYAGDGATMTKRYVFGRGVDEPIAEATGSLLDCSSAKFLHADNQGSIIAQSDCSGNRTAVNTYDEWGIPGSTNTGRFQYTGQMWLSELGMYYYKARIYSPTLGRFLQTDPIGYKDQINLYAYVGNDPVDGTDPSGLAAAESGSKPSPQAFGSCPPDRPDPVCRTGGTDGNGSSTPNPERKNWKIWIPEKPLEDDEITTTVATGIFGILASGFKAGLEAVGLKMFSRDVSQDSARLLSKVVLSDGGLNVSKTLAGKLAKDRGFIPSFAILQTIAFGRRIPDPQGVAGQFMYRIGADHLTGPSGRWSHGMLEVLVYEHTGEIRHVMYTSRPWP